MAEHPDSLSVLVVDNTPQVFVFLARLLRTQNIRALLARDSAEAFGIAERGYVPIDIVLANTTVPGLDTLHLMNRLRSIRPGLRALYMAAGLDRGGDSRQADAPGNSRINRQGRRPWRKRRFGPIDSVCLQVAAG